MTKYSTNSSQVVFAKEIQARVKDGNLEVHKDKDFADNPMDREDVAEAVNAGNIKSFADLLDGIKEGFANGLTVARLPFQEEKPLPEECFDQMVQALANESAATTQCVFTSQTGRSRSTLGTAIACIIKGVQMTNKMQLMVKEGMAEQAWADNIIRSKFYTTKEDEDPLMRGEFDVIKELLDKVPETKEGKSMADKMIDLCGPEPEGTGVHNLRRSIIQTKYKYDASTEDKQVIWKRMIVNFIERYFYLICFATYARANGADGFKKSFKAWMDEHGDLRKMIESGKDKLEWYRQVDESKISELKGMISGPDYKEKLGNVVSKLYKLAFQTYSDIPRGPIKVRQAPCM